MKRVISSGFCGTLDSQEKPAADDQTAPHCIYHFCRLRFFRGPRSATVSTAAGRGLRSRALHQVRVPHSHARRQEAVHGGVCAKDAAGGPYPFLMDRTPYSVGPYGEDQYPMHLGPSDEFEKAATSSSTRMCAGVG